MGAAAAGAAGSLAGAALGYMASRKASKEASAISRENLALQKQMFAKAERERQMAVAELEAQGIPSVEAQRIVLESPELVGLESIEQLGTSAYEDVSTDPRLREAQMNALSDLGEISVSGRTAGERAAQELGFRKIGAQAQARDEALLSDLAQRGVLGSGAEMALRQGSRQSSTQQAADFELANQAQAEQRKLAALQAVGQMGSQIRGQDFGEAAQKATAADRIAQFNLAQRADVGARNLARQQQYSDLGTQTKTQQQLHNKALLQQDYQNRMGKAQAIASARTGTAQGLMNQANIAGKTAQAQASGALASGAAKAGLYSNLGKSAGQLAGAFMGSGSTQNTNKDYSYNYNANSEASNTAEDGALMYEDGGQVYDKYAGGGIPLPEYDDRVIPGKDYSGDRIDAKINAGEMVINVEQQQRLMEMLRGLRDLRDMGCEDIIEPNPEMYGPENYEDDRQPEDLGLEIAIGEPTEKAYGGMAYQDGGYVPNTQPNVPLEADPIMRRIMEQQAATSVLNPGDIESMQARNPASQLTTEEIAELARRKNAYMETGNYHPSPYAGGESGMSDVAYKEGGMAYKEKPHDQKSESYNKPPRSLLEWHKSMIERSEKADKDNKDAKAKIKALETLMGYQK